MPLRRQKDRFVELEVFDYDVDKAVLIGPALLAQRYAAEVLARCGNFGLLVDLSYIPITYETSRYVIRCCAPSASATLSSDRAAKDTASPFRFSKRKPTKTPDIVLAGCKRTLNHT